ncbi:diacylglycerol kinase family lipid kinase [Clostridium sp. D2Q-11]|uniref:Diacylglycerol kinase family lipid kinase n=1 Tax=Anaeromonas frigoriresistens TaxID=2683708 RepID=A0A942Z5A5_9FIRM|nr:diacylglycerol kinase family protein [Anaeromonas frigoriresistens]MBS4537216.1 diacylglycerol kinase family lipid kinase [Anaeromonas frigoriresistens]
MKRIKVIYNPSSGRQMIQKRMDDIIMKLLDKGYIISKYATKKKDDAFNEAIETCKGPWDGIIVCGGDGTVNEVAFGVAISNKKLPVAILAGGTVNDFATYMEIPRTTYDFVKMIENWNIKHVDMGSCNNKYFVNVATGGLLTNVAHTVPSESKTVLGRMAYYLEGIKEIPKQKFKPIKVKITSEEYSSEEDILLFVISNGKSVGGFKKLSPTAEVQDGLLDCMIIKKAELQDIVSIFLKIYSGEHINNSKVEYFKTSDITIENLSQDEVQVDIDGEFAGELPVNIKILPNILPIFVAKTED